MKKTAQKTAKTRNFVLVPQTTTFGNIAYRITSKDGKPVRLSLDDFRALCESVRNYGRGRVSTFGGFLSVSCLPESDLLSILDGLTFAERVSKPKKKAKQQPKVEANDLQKMIAEAVAAAVAQALGK